MAGFNYARAQNTAERLLEKFGAGRKITLKRTILGMGPAHNPGPSTSIAYEASAVVLPASKGTIEAFDNRLEGGSLIDEKLRYVVMSPKLKRVSPSGPESIEPKSGDVLSFDGDDWTVLGNTPLKPAGTPILYQMGVRRSGSSV